MKDTSTELATALPTDPAAIEDPLQEFCDAALDSLALTTAAQTLRCRGLSSCDKARATWPIPIPDVPAVAWQATLVASTGRIEPNAPRVFPQLSESLGIERTR